jgi:hypothetical protein
MMQKNLKSVQDAQFCWQRKTLSIMNALQGVNSAESLLYMKLDILVVSVRDNSPWIWTL